MKRASKVSVKEEIASTHYSTHPYLFLCLVIAFNLTFYLPREKKLQMLDFLPKYLLKGTFCLLLCFCIVLFCFIYLIMVNVNSFMYRHLLVTVCLFCFSSLKVRKYKIKRIDKKSN